MSKNNVSRLLSYGYKFTSEYLEVEDEGVYMHSYHPYDHITIIDKNEIPNFRHIVTPPSIADSVIEITNAQIDQVNSLGCDTNENEV